MDSDTEQRLTRLMRQAQDGDRQAYDTLLREVAELVRSFARRRIQTQEVEDVVQETLIAIHRHRHTFDATRLFGPWMYAIASHRLLDAVRKRERRATRELPEQPALEHYLDVQHESMLSAAFAQLSASQREVIHLLKVEGYTVAEIADRTGRSESLVKITAHRGYKVLRRIMADDE